MDQIRNPAWMLIPFPISFPLFQLKLPAHSKRIHPAVVAGHLSWAEDTDRPAASNPGLATGPPALCWNDYLQRTEAGVFFFTQVTQDGKKACAAVTQIGGKRLHW